jgi:excinuclease ABC subunit A
MRNKARRCEILITFDLPLSEKFSLEESLALISGKAIAVIDRRRDRANGGCIRLFKGIGPGRLTVIQDRVKMTPANRARFVLACEQAYHFGKGKLAARFHPKRRARDHRPPQPFSGRIALRQVRSGLQGSHPGAVQFQSSHWGLPGLPRLWPHHRHKLRRRRAGLEQDSGRGSGQTLADSLQRRVSGRLNEVRPTPWRADEYPIQSLPQKWRDWVIDGDEGYGKDSEHKWPRAWYGVKGLFPLAGIQGLQNARARVASRYRVYKMCPDCHGARFQPEALLYRANGLTLADFYRLTVRRAIQFIESLASHGRR